MTHNTAIQTSSPGRRAAAYWFVDGLPEILFGATLAAWGASGFLAPAPWSKWVEAAMAVAFLIVFLLGWRILNQIKARVTYPRTGYVRPPSDPPRERQEEMITLSTAKPEPENVTWFRLRTVWLFFVAGQLIWFIPYNWVEPFIMAGTAVALYLTTRDGEHPYGWGSLAPLAVSGVPFVFVPLGVRALQSVPMVIGGVWLLAHGIVTLVKYLRTNPRPGDAA